MDNPVCNQNQHRNLKLNREMSGSKRRSRLKLGIASLPDSGAFSRRGGNLGIIEMTGPKGGGLGAVAVADDNCWKLLRRSKELLSMRTVTPELIEKLDLRREWNLSRSVDTVLDLFPSLKFAHSSLRGRKFESTVDVVSNGKSVHIKDIALSHSIRLDPVDSPKELYKYRLRIQKVIEWAYAKNLVPVMMTLTVFHRWHYLAPLYRVLSGAWSDLFRGSAGVKRKEHIGLRGYIRCLEETFNDGDSDFDESLNSGWHPHYHVILLVPREKLSVLSDYESELRKVWVSLVRKHYVKEFGEDIPASYLSSFEEHGLYFSRYVSEEHAARCGCPKGKAGGLFEVKDGIYLAKIMGVDTPLYGGDSEMTAVLLKNSKTPFDLLKGELTAGLADLWCEYAIALKKVPCFKFSQGLEKEVNEFFGSSNGIALSIDDNPSEQLVVRLKPEDYRWLYRQCLIGDLLEVAKNSGAEGAKAWLKNTYNIEVVEDEVASPDLIDSFDDVAADSFVEKTSMLVAELGKTVDDSTFDSVGCALAGFNSLNRDAVFERVGSPFKADVAVTFSSILQSWLCSPFSMRARDLNCLTIPLKSGLLSYDSRSCGKKEVSRLFLDRNKAPP